MLAAFKTAARFLNELADCYSGDAVSGCALSPSNKFVYLFTAMRGHSYSALGLALCLSVTSELLSLQTKLVFFHYTKSHPELRSSPPWAVSLPLSLPFPNLSAPFPPSNSVLNYMLLFWGIAVSCLDLDILSAHITCLPPFVSTLLLQLCRPDLMSKAKCSLP